jgi:hypothetical protein
LGILFLAFDRNPEQQANLAVNGLKALITNLLAVKGLLRLRAELKAQIKGLTIIIDLICNLLRSPWSHLLATSLNVHVSEGISLSCFQNV